MNPDGIATLIGQSDNNCNGGLIETSSSAVASSAIICRTDSSGKPTQGFQKDDQYVVEVEITGDIEGCADTVARFAIEPTDPTGTRQPTVRRSG